MLVLVCVSLSFCVYIHMVKLINLIYFNQVPFFVAPDPRSLPSIPENVSPVIWAQVFYGFCPLKLRLHVIWGCQRNLTELIVAVNVGNLLQVYASMLFERRILLCARKLSTVRTLCCVDIMFGFDRDWWKFVSDTSIKILKDSLFVYSWRLACMHLVHCCTPCTGSTYSSPCFPHTFWTTAGEKSVCPAAQLVPAFELTLSVLLQCSNALSDWGSQQSFWGEETAAAIWVSDTHPSLSVLIMQGLRSSGLEDVVILDVDSNTVESPFDDLKRIPANVVNKCFDCLLLCSTLK